jgi:hypothetical protein
LLGWSAGSTRMQAWPSLSWRHAGTAPAESNRLGQPRSTFFMGVLHLSVARLL